MSDPSSPICPICKANLDEVGIRTELHDWAETRKKGRARYVLMHGLGIAAVMVLSAPVAYFIRGRIDAAEVVIFTGCHCLGGLAVGWMMWRSNEKEFAAHRHLLEEMEEEEPPD